MREITSYYHIFCCNMLIFACPIIAKSVLVICPLPSGQIRGKYPYLPSYIRICPRIQLPYLRSGIKVQGKMMHKDMHKIVFQSY